MDFNIQSTMAVMLGRFVCSMLCILKTNGQVYMPSVHHFRVHSCTPLCDLRNVILWLVCVCVCVCVCERERERVRVCVCVCERERERVCVCV